MTTICIIRHGQTDWNKNHLIQGRIDNKLNDTGKKQAYEVAHLLKEYDNNWDIIISSPLSRAIETATIIKDELNYNQDLIINDNVIEREFGKAEGEFITDEIYDRIKKDDIIGMEKTKELQLRAFHTIMDIGKKYEGKRILIISHSHFIKGLFTYLSKDITFTSILPNTGLNYIYIENKEITNFIFNKKIK